MFTRPYRTAAALAVGFCLTAAPVLAQRDRQGRSEGGRSEPRRAVPRAQTGGQPSGERAGGGPRARSEVAPRGTGRRAEVGPRREVGPAASAVQPGRAVQSGAAIQRWPNGGQRADGRQAAPYYRGAARVRPAVPQSRAYAYSPSGSYPRGYYPNGYYARGYYPRGYYAPRHYAYYGGGYYPSPGHVYAVPYGYRPYGYRPGWNFNLYFGFPYVGGHVYGGQPYGYYAVSPGVAYGAVRIVDAPGGARVFVDGYYAGEVDEYDGVFQRLNLEAGAHRIEVELQPGLAPIPFDVRIVPGETVTIHVDDRQ